MRHVAQHRGAVEYVFVAKPRALEDRADVLQRLFGLGVDSVGQLAVRADAELARQIKDIPNAYRVENGGAAEPRAAQVRGNTRRRIWPAQRQPGS